LRLQQHPRGQTKFPLRRKTREDLTQRGAAPAANVSDQMRW
jgi:hypothetical protein